MSIEQSSIYPLQFSPAELSYLLSLVGSAQFIHSHANSLIGVTPAEQEVLWQTGYTELLANGWLTTAEATGDVQIDNRLIPIIKTLAYPKQVVITQFGQRDTLYQEVTHYWDDQYIVELKRVNEKFDLLILESMAAWLIRSQHILDLPQTVSETAVAIKLSIDDFKRLKKVPDINILLSQEIPLLAAQLLVDTLSYSPQSARFMQLFPRLDHPIASEISALLWCDRHIWHIRQDNQYLYFEYVTAIQALSDMSLPDSGKRRL